MTPLKQGDVIFTPTSERLATSGLQGYMDWLKETKGLTFVDYEQLWQWSVDHLSDFWETVWDFSEVIFHEPYEQVLDKEVMPDAKWFTGATLNFAENIFAQANEERPALYFKSELTKTTAMSWQSLQQKVASLAEHLRKLGVQAGDRVAAYLPNTPEAIIGFLASASIGAIWSICAPDFGSRSVIDRFTQIEPKVLIAIDGYPYNGKNIDKRDDVQKIAAALDTVEHQIFVPYIQDDSLEDWIKWDTLVEDDVALTYEILPFDHPLWIVYSSGTTGLPKAIVQSHGAMTVEYKKMMMIQNGSTENEVVYWFTSSGWMMWNMLVGNLISGDTIVLYDGSPFYPNENVLWDLIDELGISLFGTSAPFILQAMKMQLNPRKTHDLSTLKSIFSTGAPLTGDGYNWVYGNVKEDVWLVSSSGGTDVASGFVGGVVNKPVKVGEIQGRILGVAAYAYDETGEAVTNQVGELVITKPMPSMPIYFWNDTDGSRYFNSYFTDYKGVWKHGDWMKIDETGSCIIYGRSDSTINRSGVRMGTSDLYRVIGSLEEVVDSLVIDLEMMGQSNRLLYFVILREGITLDDEIKDKIKQAIRTEMSPRFMPDEVYQVADIPRTLNGKKLEVPIRKLLLGFEKDKVINQDSMGNPKSLDYFVTLSEQFKKDQSIGFMS